LNDTARQLYYEEVQKLTATLNKPISDEQPKIQVPDLKFNRQIGHYAGKYFDIYGQPMTKEEFEKYLPTVMPSEEDEKALESVFKEGGWIVPKGEGEFEPSEGARRVH